MSGPCVCECVQSLCMCVRAHAYVQSMCTMCVRTCVIVSVVVCVSVCERECVNQTYNPLFKTKDRQITARTTVNCPPTKPPPELGLSVVDGDAPSLELLETGPAAGDVGRTLVDLRVLTVDAAVRSPFVGSGSAFARLS